jgi:hypothetical protein
MAFAEWERANPCPGVKIRWVRKGDASLHGAGLPKDFCAEFSVPEHSLAVLR